jgi:Secretion system C-terminal sorting domain
MKKEFYQNFTEKYKLGRLYFLVCFILVGFASQVHAQVETVILKEVLINDVEIEFNVTTPTKYRIELWGAGSTTEPSAPGRGRGAGGYCGKEITLPVGTYYYGNFQGLQAYFKSIADLTIINMLATAGEDNIGGGATGGDQNITGGNGAYELFSEGGGGGASGQWNLPAGTDLNASAQFGGDYPGRVDGGRGGNGSFYLTPPPPNPPITQQIPASAGGKFGGGGGGNNFAGVDPTTLFPYEPGAAGAAGIKITKISCDDVTSVSIDGGSSICEGNSTEFTASFLPATANNVTYQWYKDNASIPTATTASYTATEAGVYKVIAQTTCNASSPVTVSAEKTLTVDLKPVLTTPPANATVCIGAEATFTVVGANIGSYIWASRVTSATIPGATGPSYTTSAAGAYYVICNAAGACATAGVESITTADFSLINTTDEVINITSEPAANIADCEENYLKLTVVATGTITSYQWKKDGVNMDGVTTAELEFNSLAVGNAGKYQLEITGPCGTVLSKEYTLVVNPIYPIFSPIAPICSGDPAPILPSVSENGMTGTWSPAVVSNTTTATYTFTPDDVPCLGFTATLRVTVNDCSMSVISGVVYEDADGAEINGTPLTVGGTYISVFRVASGGPRRISAVPLHVASVTAGTGAYTFPALAAGKYKLVIGTSATGSDIPSYPNIGNFSMTAGAEGIGGGSTGDGLPDGITFVTLSVNPPINSRSRVRIDASIDFALKQDAALPVRLVSFAGKNTENGNQLTWKTSSEVNFSHFEVEKSEDSKKFEKIGEVKGNKAETYEFLDNSPIKLEMGYYRLKMIDLDGSSAFSKIIIIEGKNIKNSIGQFYPNPSTGQAKVDVNATESGIWSIKTFDLQGRLLNTQSQFLQKGSNIIQVESLTKGINYIQISEGQKTEIRKIIYQ